MKIINGQTETQYVLGAIALVERELASATLRSDMSGMLDASERLDALKVCLISALRDDSAPLNR